MSSCSKKLVHKQLMNFYQCLNNTGWRIDYWPFSSRNKMEISKFIRIKILNPNLKIKRTLRTNCLYHEPKMKEMIIGRDRALQKYHQITLSGGYPMCSSTELVRIAANSLCIKYHSCNISTSSNVNKENNGKFWTKQTILIALGGLTVLGAVTFKILNNESNQTIEIVPSEHVKSEKYPHNSSDLPDEVQYVIVGGGTAAFSACRTIKTRDANAQVLMLSKEPFYPYMKPPLSKDLFYNEDREKAENFVFKQWNGVERSLFYEKEGFYTSCSELNKSETGGIAVALGWKVISVNPLEKVVNLEGGKRIKYDKCLLATGSTPKNLPILKNLPVNIQDKVTHYDSISDFKAIDNIIKKGVKSIAIFGSDVLSCELACAIYKRGAATDFGVTQILENTAIMEDVIPTYLSEWLQTKMQDEGIKIINKASIEDITLENNQLNIKLSNGQQVGADHLLICIGSEANTDIARTSGLEIDKNLGGFVVNSELQARSNLFAAGDCASYYDNFVGQRRSIHHYDYAIASGRVAGENMTGSGKPIKHQPMFWSEVGSNMYEAVGYINPNLRTVGVFVDDIDDADVKKSHSTQETEVSKKKDYSKGVVFFLDHDIIEGILLWNVFNQLPIARQIIAERKEVTNFLDVAKLFKIV